jgi:RHS repeat-associated protein
MSNKSGTSSRVISLPKGGGALHGIGEKFSPDLFTGTGNFTVPIALPPGRNGFQPELNLVYSTGNGNGDFGLGWGLSIPGISRKTSKGIPRYDDNRDVFILSGAEDLVLVKEERFDTDTDRRLSVTYRPRTEGLFARIQYHHIVHLPDGPVQDYWEVRSKDSLVSYYGTAELPANADNTWVDPAVIANPGDRSNIFSWSLTQTRDPFGNVIVYDYDRNSGVDGPHHWDQLYLKRIRYADYGDRDAPQFLVSVAFEYETRPDPFSEYRSGFEIRTQKRCRTIHIHTHAEREQLTRTYQLVYLDQRKELKNLEQLLPLNGVSLLSQVKVIGHDGDRTEELPPLEFGYTGFEPEGRDFSPLEGRDLPARSLANPELELADLFGNGLPDILEMNGTVRYWRNLGNGRFDLPREMKEAPAGLQLADAGVQLLDANGDGRIDLLVTQPGLSGYFPLKFGGLWDQKSFQPYAVAPSFNLEDPEVRLVDLSGDGVTDAIRSGSRLECFFNDPLAGWKETRWVERRDIEDFPNINFSDPRVKWGDMSGDGLQDIVLVYDGNIEYWPNLGYGNWGKRVSMRNSPRFRYGYDPRRILIGDVDGDGLADLVYVDNNQVILWINQSGNGWSDPIAIKGTPSVTDMDAVRLVDLLGTGISGVLWSADASGLSRSHLYFLDFTGGVKPYLLHQMDNHMGAVTKVEYQPSSRFYLEDEQQRQPWKTPLPLPVLTVAKVEVIDQISKGKLTTEYRYHHGYWDGAEREFRGFGRVEQWDTETFEDYDQAGLHGSENGFVKVDRTHFSPPTLTKTWFHQGPVGEEFGEWEETDYRDEYWAGDGSLLERPAEMQAFLKTLPRRAKRDALRTLRGRILRTELYALDGTERQTRPYTVTESLSGVREEVPPSPEETGRLPIFFPHTLAQRTSQWERGNEPMTQFSFTEDYDAYGQPRRQIQIACPRGWQGTSKEYLATVAETSFAQRDDRAVYIVDRVATATSYELTPTTAMTIADLRQAASDDRQRQLIGQALNFYDGEAFTGLPTGVLGQYGALVRSETLILDQSILQEAYGTDIPPYFVSNGMPDEYPPDFRELLPVQATSDPTRPGLTITPIGYGFAAGDAPEQRRYFVATERRRYDFQSGDGSDRGLVLAMRDPLGLEATRDTTIAYDAYDLLPTKVTDPAGLTTTAAYDYRVLQPGQVTDPNGNQSEFRFSPLGLLTETWVKGKPANAEGDRQRPSTRLEYDFLAFDHSPPDQRQPIFVRTIRHTHHDTETDIELPKRDETIESREYSDGFGRLVQTRTQGEDVRFGDAVFGGGEMVLPANQSDGAGGDVVGVPNLDPANPNVVVSGWQVYDNKGRVVQKYEPFFSMGWGYALPVEQEFGQKVTMYYDPRGQVIRTVNPDRSEQRVIYGIPEDLSQPQRFRPTPWEAYTYDANDNGGRTHASQSAAYQPHWNTPSSAVVDALGRTVETVERNGPTPATDWYHTRSTYDIRGNPLTVTDALGREAFRYVYDLTPKKGQDQQGSQVLRIDSIDAGVRRVVFDAVGNEVERRDGKGALILQAYDSLNRPSRMWARDKAGETVTLQERLEYGDSPDAGLTRVEAQRLNLLGRLYQHYDEAGRLTFRGLSQASGEEAAYDFKGNVLEKVRQVIGDGAIVSALSQNPPGEPRQTFQVDWQLEPAELLDSTPYQTSATYDALNRVKLMRYPLDVNQVRQVLVPEYNRAGALEKVSLNNQLYVERIAYNAKGQRVLIAYGNGVMTRYAYDPETFRLVRLRTDRFTQPADLTYHPTGMPLQDFAYRYDLVGNITALKDRTPGSGILNTPSGPDALDRAFTYDPIYCLLSATGRECDIPPNPPAPWREDQPRCADLTRTRAYREAYQYDAVGNMRQLHHEHIQADGSVLAINREFTLVGDGSPVPLNNRLATVTIGQTEIEYGYDANGNLTNEGESRQFEWDHSDQMRAFREQAPGSSEASVVAQYLYDAGGQRVKKLVRKGANQFEVTVYIDGGFEYHYLVTAGEPKENNTLHVMDDQQRIALVRVGEPFDRLVSTPAVQYHLGDHLGSSNVVIDGNGGWINREEYTPYGETSFGSFKRKRYRFTGKERDEESGLYYHGARYYALWLVRWVSCDPKGTQDSLNVYVYAKNNPIYFKDIDGAQSTKSTPSYSEVLDRYIDINNPQQPNPGNLLPKSQGVKISLDLNLKSASELDLFLTEKLRLPQFSGLQLEEPSSYGGQDYLTKIFPTMEGSTEGQYALPSKAEQTICELSFLRICLGLELKQPPTPTLYPVIYNLEGANLNTLYEYIYRTAPIAQEALELLELNTLGKESSITKASIKKAFPLILEALAKSLPPAYQKGLQSIAPVQVYEGFKLDLCLTLSIPALIKQFGEEQKDFHSLFQMQISGSFPLEDILRGITILSTRLQPKKPKGIPSWP